MFALPPSLVSPPKPKEGAEFREFRRQVGELMRSYGTDQEVFRPPEGGRWRRRLWWRFDGPDSGAKYLRHLMPGSRPLRYGEDGHSECTEKTLRAHTSEGCGSLIYHIFILSVLKKQIYEFARERS